MKYELVYRNPEMKEKVLAEFNTWDEAQDHRHTSSFYVRPAKEHEL